MEKTIEARRFVTKANVKDGKTTIEYYMQTAAGRTEYSISSTEAPHPSFNGALNALADVLGYFWELPEEWLETLEMRGATFDENEVQGFGGTMYGIRKNDRIKGVTVCNTPHIFVGTDAMKGQPSCMSDKQAEALRRFQMEAEAFIDGRRAQGNLFDVAKAAANDKDEAEENVVVEFARGKNIAEKPKKEKKPKTKIIKRKGVKGVREPEPDEDERDAA